VLTVHVGKICANALPARSCVFACVRQYATINAQINLGYVQYLQLKTKIARWLVVLSVQLAELMVLRCHKDTQGLKALRPASGAVVRPSGLLRLGSRAHAAKLLE